MNFTYLLREMRIWLSDRRKSRSTETKDKNTAGYQIPGWDEDDRRRKYDNRNTFSPSLTNLAQ